MLPKTITVTNEGYSRSGTRVWSATFEPADGRCYNLFRTGTRVKVTELTWADDPTREVRATILTEPWETFATHYALPVTLGLAE